MDFMINTPEGANLVETPEDYLVLLSATKYVGEAVEIITANYRDLNWEPVPINVEFTGYSAIKNLPGDAPYICENKPGLKPEWKQLSIE